MTTFKAGGQTEVWKNLFFSRANGRHTSKNRPEVKGETSEQSFMRENPAKGAGQGQGCLYIRLLQSIWISRDTAHVHERKYTKHLSSTVLNQLKRPQGTVSFFNKLRSKTSSFSVPLVERWGRKWNAFPKQQFPSHLLQLAASEQTRNSSLNKKKKKKVQPRRGQQKLFGVAWLAFTQQLLVYTWRPVRDSVTATGTENSMLIHSTFWPKYTSHWDPVVCGNSCLQLLKIISANSSCSVH